MLIVASLLAWTGAKNCLDGNPDAVVKADTFEESSATDFHLIYFRYSWRNCVVRVQASLASAGL